MDTIEFVWLFVTPLVFLLCLIILVMFWKEKIVRLAGLYAILPGINLFIVSLIPPHIDLQVAAFVSVVTDLVFIVPVVFLLRELYKKGFFVPWVLLAFELLRSSMLILYSLSSRPTLSYFETALFYFYYFFTFIILLYCVLTKNKLKET